MGHFPPSEGYTHILVAVDYITKWVEAIPTKSADGETSLKRLGIPAAGDRHRIRTLLVRCRPPSLPRR
jgi:hypothetical protein